MKKIYPLLLENQVGMRRLSSRVRLRLLLIAVVLGAACATLTTKAAPLRFAPSGKFSITVANGTASGTIITGPIALTPGLTLQVTNRNTSSIDGNTTPISWAWQRNDVVIPSTTGSVTILVTQPGIYSIKTDPNRASNSTDSPTCICSSQVVEVFDTPALNGQPLNYTVETTILKPGITAAQTASLGIAERTQSTALSDGFGRTIQTIQQQAAPDQSDIINFQKYDSYGQPSTTYLPYTRTPTTADFPFSRSPITEQSSFYTSASKVAVDTNPSATTTFEASPLARPTQQTQPGADWQNHPSTQAFASNATDEVRRWIDLTGNTFYPAQALTKETRQDPDGRRSEVFRDQSGKVVLQRQYNDLAPHDTYTVYNAVGKVQYVIPPAAFEEAEVLGIGYDFSAPDFVKRWLYQYVYDDMGRLQSRCFPGAQPVYMVYDQLDRLILTQDGNARQANRWFFTKYDVLGRPAVEGIFNSGSSRATLQAAADAWTGVAYEQRKATALKYTTNGAYPAMGDGTNGRVLSLTFYDEYDLDMDGNPDFAYRAQSLGGNEPIPTDRTRGRVAVTRRRIILSNGLYGDWLTTVNFYDVYGNVIQTQSDSHLAIAVDNSMPNVTTLIYREHGYVPQLLLSIKAQSNTSEIEVRNRYEYGASGHLLSVWQQNNWNGSNQPEVLVASYAYNALGQLVEKNLHSSDQGQTFLQSVDFRYTIQGGLSSINNGALTPDGGVSNDDSDDVFGLELVRHKQDSELSNTPRFDGGISAVRWQAHNSRQQQQPERQRAYTFAYDGLGRLTDALYAAKVDVAFSAESGAYDEREITYDAGGNIKSLKRSTQQTDASGAKEIDDLVYTYIGNQLQSVDDKADGEVGFRDKAQSKQEYLYDENGSVIVDKNKAVSFEYNALNKVRLQTTAGGSIAYVYDAAGTVLQRKVTNNKTGKLQVFDYVDGFAYIDTEQYKGLSSVPTPEGRVVVLTTSAESAPDQEQPIGSPSPIVVTPVPTSAPRLVFEYHLRDHLGNLRVAFRAEVLQERQHLTMESPATEEGAYPAFTNVTSTQTPNYFYEGTHSASVTATTPGPATRIPVVNGDAVKVDLFYLTPAGIQVSRPSPPTPPKATRWAPTLALAPLLLPNPTEHRTEGSSASRMWPGLQLTLSGLLSRTKRPAGPAPVVQADFSALSTAGTFDAYVGWTLYDSNNQPLSSGTAVVPVMTNGMTNWNHFSTSIPVAINTSNGAGYLQVQLLNSGAQPVYFDSVSIRHPRAGLLISQENHYYPFGMNLKGVAVNTAPAEQISKQQYNGGSLLEDDLLDDEEGIYSTLYRTYDPSIGRFQGVDPLADKYARINPYNFAFNDPANANDPTGAAPPLSAASMRMAMTLFDATDKDGSSYWNHNLGGAFSDAKSTMSMIQAGAYNNLPKVAKFQGTFSSIQFETFTDNHGTVESHSVVEEIGATVTGSPSDNTEQDESLFSAASIGNLFIGEVDLAIAIGLEEVKASANMVKLGKTTSAVGSLITVGLIVYEFKSGKADTHTFVSGGVAVLGVGAIALVSVIGAPVAIGITAVVFGYNLINASGIIDESIDNWSNHSGRDLIYNKPK